MLVVVIFVCAVLIGFNVFYITDEPEKKESSSDENLKNK